MTDWKALHESCFRLNQTWLFFLSVCSLQKLFLETVNVSGVLSSSVNLSHAGNWICCFFCTQLQSRLSCTDAVIKQPLNNYRGFNQVHWRSNCYIDCTMTELSARGFVMQHLQWMNSFFWLVGTLQVRTSSVTMHDVENHGLNPIHPPK